MKKYRSNFKESNISLNDLDKFYVWYAETYSALDTRIRDAKSRARYDTSEQETIESLQKQIEGIRGIKKIMQSIVSNNSIDETAKLDFLHEFFVSK